MSRQKLPMLTSDDRVCLCTKVVIEKVIFRRAHGCLLSISCQCIHLLISHERSRLIARCPGYLCSQWRTIFHRPPLSTDEVSHKLLLFYRRWQPLFIFIHGNFTTLLLLLLSAHLKKKLPANTVLGRDGYFRRHVMYLWSMAWVFYATGCG